MEQSDEELEHPAEEDSDHDDAEDLDKMFGNWLGELDTLTKDLDTNKVPVAKLAKNESNLANFRYRFSMHNLHEALNQGEEVDLDALMADLCSMGQELENITKEPSQPAAPPKPPAAPEPVRAIPASVVAGVRVKPASVKPHAKVNTCDQAQLSLEELTAQLEQASVSIEEAAASVAAQPAVLHPQQQQPAPTDRVTQESKSGDVSSDSTSSRSSLASLASSQDSERSRSRESDLSQQASTTTPVNEEEQEAKLKAEKIKMALEKIKEAQIKKLVVRIHLTDSSSKTMMVDERQTVRQVLDSLAEKSHTDGSPDWSLVEVIPELHMERFFEDSENLVENLLNWTRDSPNMLMFVARKEKYAIFKNPQNYLLGTNETSEMADRNKEALLEECFCGSTVTVPELEGVLYLKEDGKKSWKKRYFLLRASGIYYVPKGKTKTLRDLSCFIQFDHVSVYYGQDFRTKYKAPTEYCFALKHPQIQKKSQYIKYLCCDDASGLQQWVTGIRVAKYGRTMYDNYQEALKRAEVTSDWSSLSSSSMKSASSSGSIPESHSGHTEVGMSDTTSGSHTRSQSIVSTMFSEAWRRGTQIEEQNKERHAKAEGDSKANAIPPPPLSGLKPFQNCSVPSVIPPPPPDSLHLSMGPLPPPPPPLPASFTKLPGVQAMPLPPPPPSMSTLSQPPVKLAAPAQVINYSVKLSTSAVNTSHIPPVALPGHALSTQPIPPQLPPFPAVTQPAVKVCKTQPPVQMSACQAPPPPPPPLPANAFPLAAHSQLGLSARFSTPVSNNHSILPLSLPRPDEDFPPPPVDSDTQKGFFLPFPPPLPPPKQIPHHLLPTSIPGERVPSSPSHGASPRSGKRPPPTPQRNSSVKESREGVASSVERMGVTDTEQTAMSRAPSTQAKPGKLNFAARNIPIVFPPPGSKLKSAVMSPELPPPPPPEEADFPPPPFMNVDCLPPPPELPLHAKQPSGPPAILPKPPAVHMPQASKVACGQESPPRKQAAPSGHEGPAQSPPKPSSTKAAFSQKKVAPPTLPKRSDSTRLSGHADAPGSPPVLMAEVLDASNPGAPGSPSALSAASPSSSPSRPGGLAQASFIADLNRTLKRKSLKQHVGSPMHGADDATLPPPPPELLREPDSPSVSSPGVSRYATLRRAAAPPPPPKRDNSTRLTHD